MTQPSPYLAGQLRAVNGGLDMGKKMIVESVMKRRSHVY
jgi:hypothetical protein